MATQKLPAKQTILTVTHLLMVAHKLTVRQANLMMTYLMMEAHKLRVHQASKPDDDLPDDGSAQAPGSSSKQT